jgi:hypothetical protein
MSNQVHHRHELRKAFTDGLKRLEAAIAGLIKKTLIHP